jgi:hypothetical protein
MVYENFKVEVGLNDTPFNWSYDDYGHLSTKETWLQNLWLLTHTFKAEMVFHKEDQVTGLQEGNRPLMSEFCCVVGYQGRSWKR